MGGGIFFGGPGAIKDLQPHNACFLEVFGSFLKVSRTPALLHQLAWRHYAQGKHVEVNKTLRGRMNFKGRLLKKQTNSATKLQKKDANLRPEQDKLQNCS